ncbi:MAG: hypothetical protein KDA96_14995, partial [Planctomycetaceae bacterium]|nr:hypothetical protein [Planctomycetaceae bacterium]
SASRGRQGKAGPRRTSDDRLFVADSKKVHAAGAGVSALELPVMAFLGNLPFPSATLHQLCSALAGDAFERDFRDEPWNDRAEITLPTTVSRKLVEQYSQRLQRMSEASQVRLLSVRSRIIFPAEFNRDVRAADSKGVVLSRNTMQLVRAACDAHAGFSQTEVTCDKHGGRNRYDELVSEAFDDAFVFRLQESMASSSYRMGDCTLTFRVKAEEVLPVAMASMVSKYLREVLMDQFNAFWIRHLPDLRPTRGYPADAKRFDEEITAIRESLGITRESLWRER